jgi:hypothetical protein
VKNPVDKSLYAGLRFAPQTEHLPSDVIIGCLSTSFPQVHTSKYFTSPKNAFSALTKIEKYSLELFVIRSYIH